MSKVFQFRRSTTPVASELTVDTTNNKIFVKNASGVTHQILPQSSITALGSASYQIKNNVVNAYASSVTSALTVGSVFKSVTTSAANIGGTSGNTFSVPENSNAVAAQTISIPYFSVDSRGRVVGYGTKSLVVSATGNRYNFYYKQNPSYWHYYY